MNAIQQRRLSRAIPKFLFLGRFSEEHFSGSQEVHLVKLLQRLVVCTHICLGTVTMEGVGVRICGFGAKWSPRRYGFDTFLDSEPGFSGLKHCLQPSAPVAHFREATNY